MKKLTFAILCSLTVLGGCRPTAKSEGTRFLRSTAHLHSYATAEWDELLGKYRRPNIGDWSATADSLISNGGFPTEIAVAYRESMLSAREFVHQQGLPLRAVAPKQTIEALDNLEAAFDTVFMRCIAEEYYMRLLPDIYDEVIPARIDAVAKSINQ